MMPLSMIKANQENPRIISESKLKKLINSMLVFPKMMSLRPITIDDDNRVLGGNMRLTALGRIAQMSQEDLRALLSSLPEFDELPDGGREVLAYWDAFTKKPQAEVQYARDLTDSEKRQFIIKDNVSFGDWDYDELENWDMERLEDWGVETQMPDFGDMTGGGGQEPTRDNREHDNTETSRLSELKFVDCYYTPEKRPDIRLEDCADLELFEKKIRFIEDSGLSDEQKEMMRVFAYRFVKIDFQSIADYYAFNASEEEKRVIERLRLVLVDGALDGFFEDNMLRVNDHFTEESEDTDADD